MGSIVIMVRVVLSGGFMIGVHGEQGNQEKDTEMFMYRTKESVDRTHQDIRKHKGSEACRGQPQIMISTGRWVNAGPTSQTLHQQ